MYYVVLLGRQYTTPEKHLLWSSKKLYWTKKMKSITVQSIDVSLFAVSLFSAQTKVVDFKYIPSLYKENKLLSTLVITAD